MATTIPRRIIPGIPTVTRSAGGSCSASDLITDTVGDGNDIGDVGIPPVAIRIGAAARAPVTPCVDRNDACTRLPEPIAHARAFDRTDAAVSTTADA